MKREHSLRRRLRSLEALSEAIAAMKSLSAHHFRGARSALPAAHAYRDGIDQALAAIGVHQMETPGDADAILLIAADLGLCGGYNSKLASAAVDHHARHSAAREAAESKARWREQEGQVAALAAQLKTAATRAQAAEAQLTRVQQRVNAQMSSTAVALDKAESGMTRMAAQLDQVAAQAAEGEGSA